MRYTDGNRMGWKKSKGHNSSSYDNCSVYYPGYEADFLRIKTPPKKIVQAILKHLKKLIKISRKNLM